MCIAQVSADPQRLILTGSSTVVPMVGEMARRFETLHPGVRIDVQTGGASRGINDVRKGVAVWHGITSIKVE